MDEELEELLLLGDVSDWMAPDVPVVMVVAQGSMGVMENIERCW